jgi:hypothetical protein
LWGMPCRLRDSCSDMFYYFPPSFSLHKINTRGLQRIAMYLAYKFFASIYLTIILDHLKIDLSGGSMGGCGTKNQSPR